MDVADKAQEFTEFWTRRSIERHERAMAITSGLVSLKKCARCGRSIPEPRRRAISGCTHCVSCQEELENGKQL